MMAMFSSSKLLYKKKLKKKTLSRLNVNTLCLRAYYFSPEKMQCKHQVCICLNVFTKTLKKKKIN